MLLHVFRKYPCLSSVIWKALSWTIWILLRNKSLGIKKNLFAALIYGISSSMQDLVNHSLSQFFIYPISPFLFHFTIRATFYKNIFKLLTQTRIFQLVNSSFELLSLCYFLYKEISSSYSDKSKIDRGPEVIRLPTFQLVIDFSLLFSFANVRNLITCVLDSNLSTS